MWTELSSPVALDEFMGAFNGFHDSCLREVSLATETFVDERRIMTCPGHMDTSALMFFQSQMDELSAIELRCTGVSHFRLRPTGENCDSIIDSATITLENGQCRVAVQFVGGPLLGVPNTSMWLPGKAPADSDLEVVARSIEWRPCPTALGDQLRYRSADRGKF